MAREAEITARTIRIQSVQQLLSAVEEFKNTTEGVNHSRAFHRLDSHANDCFEVCTQLHQVGQDAGLGQSFEEVVMNLASQSVGNYVLGDGDRSRSFPRQPKRDDRPAAQCDMVLAKYDLSASDDCSLSQVSV